MAQIGAGARIYIGTGAVPSPALTGINGLSGGTLTTFKTDYQIAGDVNNYLYDAKVATTEGEVDVTKLGADVNGFWKSHIVALNDAKLTCKYDTGDGGDQTGAFIIWMQGIRTGILHTLGRGFADIVIRPFGDATGKLQIRGTLSIPSLSIDIATATVIGGDLSFSFTGPVYFEAQS